MRKNAWIMLLIAGICVGFVMGATIARSRKPETTSGEPALEEAKKKRQSEDDAALLASLERLRRALAEREREAETLKTEAAELRSKLPPPLSPEEEKSQQRWERQQAIKEKAKELQTKIAQRKNEALRAEGLQELIKFLQSDNADDVLLGLTTLPLLEHVNVDNERFRPHVIAALNHEDGEVRTAALRCLYAMYPGEDHFDLVLPMLDDPFPGIRSWVVGGIAYAAQAKHRDEAIAEMRRFLRDEDKWSRLTAMRVLWSNPESRSEVEDIAIEMSRNPELVGEAVSWLRGRDTISGKVARRLAELYDEGHKETHYDGEYYDPRWTHRPLSDEARPIAAEFCLRALRNSVHHSPRITALEGLRSIGEISVLPALEEIARSPDVEGIEDELAETIRHLQKQQNQPR